MSYREIFTSTTGLDPLHAATQALASRARDLLTDQLSDALRTQLGQDRNALLDLLMSHVVLPGLGDQGLLVIVNYPAEQAALARLHPDEPEIAERFEVFYRGVELANGYRELGDAAEQAARFERDRLRRHRHGKPDIRPDPSLLAALEHGLPDCCGVALGFDRVVMLALGLADIAEATSFALQEPI
jgi:lysyl-tRNA synthetase class 2